MGAYEVGKPYNPRVKQWPETVKYNFRGGQHELVLFFANCSDQEREAIGVGPVEFAVNSAASPDVLFFLYRFPAAQISWSDAPFAFGRLPADQRVLPPALGPGQRMLLNIILVEATNGIILRLRAVSLSPHFTQVLNDAIIAQAARPYSDQTYDAEINRVYALHKTSSALLSGAVRTHGGD